MFWKVEIDKEGSILSCETVASIGKNGSRVIYVEAETKVDACTNAKAWHEHKKAYMRTFTKERRDKRIRDGMCTGCGKNRAREGRRTCTTCANSQSARDKSGGAGRELLTPEEAARRQEAQSTDWRRRRGGSKGSTLRGVLHKFDEMNPDTFRLWLVGEIARIDSEFKDPVEHFHLIALAGE